MKYPLFTLLLLVFANGLFAQKADTVFVSVSRDSGMLEKNKFVDRYDDIFGIHVPSKWLFKWNVGRLLPQTSSNYNTVSSTTSSAVEFMVERKLSARFSINATYAYNFGRSNYFYTYANGSLVNSFVSRHELAIEPRYYLGMKNRIREGRAASNFSGNYLGIELRHGRRHNAGENYLPSTEFNSASFRFGIQRRVFNFAYFDISTGVGVHHFPSTRFSRGQTALISDARFGIGLALARPKASIEKSPDYCSALQCFREERRMWKLDLFNMVRLNTTDNIKATINVAMEQKLGASPFSIEASGELGGQLLQYSNIAYSVDQLSWGGKLQLQGRYYYNLKKRIAKGKSGNNLSGAYLALQSSGSYAQSRLNANSNNSLLDGNGQTAQTTSGLVWGIQYRILKHAYLDFNLGAGVANTWQAYHDVNGSTTKTNYRNELAILSALKIGWAF